jgi:2-polyprenyl-3-methyl-5-hydroxy-6-metoxy-1,4-benzoquinol methylase
MNDNDVSAEEKQILIHEYFDIVENKSVLEIGPFHGKHTELLQEKNPSSIVAIEPDLVSANNLQRLLPVDNIICQDIHHYLEHKHQFDVVVCLGILYHFHDPLWILELIANRCDPEYILVDCVVDTPELSFLREEINIGGNRIVDNNWKSCNFTLVAPFEVIDNAMKDLGYVLEKQHELKIQSWFPKSNSWIARWKKLP